VLGERPLLSQSGFRLWGNGTQGNIKKRTRRPTEKTQTSKKERHQQKNEKKKPKTAPNPNHTHEKKHEQVYFNFVGRVVRCTGSQQRASGGDGQTEVRGGKRCGDEREKPNIGWEKKRQSSQTGTNWGHLPQLSEGTRKGEKQSGRKKGRGSARKIRDAVLTDRPCISPKKVRKNVQEKRKP